MCGATCARARRVAAIDALDEPELPQRMVAVEDLLHEPLGERDQLAAVTRARAAAVRRTWRAMSKPGSSTQIGRPSPNGMCSTRRRKRGMSGSRERRDPARRRAGSDRRARRTAPARAPRSHPRASASRAARGGGSLVERTEPVVAGRREDWGQSPPGSYAGAIGISEGRRGAGAIRTTVCTLIMS